MKTPFRYTLPLLSGHPLCAPIMNVLNTRTRFALQGRRYREIVTLLLRWYVIISGDSMRRSSNRRPFPRRNRLPRHFDRCPFPPPSSCAAPPHLSIPLLRSPSSEAFGPPPSSEREFQRVKARGKPFAGFDRLSLR